MRQMIGQKVNVKVCHAHLCCLGRQVHHPHGQLLMQHVCSLALGQVGHGGTLDPMATGVLVLGIGSGCKAMEAYLKVAYIGSGNRDNSR